MKGQTQGLWFIGMWVVHQPKGCEFKHIGDTRCGNKLSLKKKKEKTMAIVQPGA